MMVKGDHAMSAPSEDILLRRFVTARDTSAFSQIVHAHAGLVYNVCLRILGDRERAADATQETFFQLLRRAGQIKASVPAWLHRVATRKAVDMIRSDSSRQRTEAEYADRQAREAETWQDLAPHVDEALNALDEQTRDLLVQYYFENRSMADIAEERGISHPTVSRRIEAGRGQLRGEFSKKGIIVAAAALSSLLAENAAQAVPAGVVSELAKVALVGTETATGTACSTVATSTARTALSALAASAKTKVIFAIAVGAVAITGTAIYKHTAGQSTSTGPKPDGSQMSSHQSRQVTPSNSTTPASPSAESGAGDVPGSIAQEPLTTQDSQLPPSSSEPAGAEIGSAVPEQSGLADDRTVDESSANKFDLSTPQAAFQTYIRMFALGDFESGMECVNPDSYIYDVVHESVISQPGDKAYNLILLYQSIDLDAEMYPTIVEQDQTGTRVSYTATFKHDFVAEGLSFPAGSQIETDIVLVERDGKWLVHDF
jgi:RNA polymerase sigma-70 factor (ECF subfamily)